MVLDIEFEVPLQNQKWKYSRVIWVEWNRVQRARDEKFGIISVYIIMKAVALDDIFWEESI